MTSLILATSPPGTAWNSALLTTVFPATDLERWYVPLAFALVVLMVYQQLRLYKFRQHAAKREELFRIVAENAADMIALVDTKGRRLYNSPAYQTVLGYSAQELAQTPAFEQIHPEDRFKVLEAAREARTTGVGKKLEYRMRHKNGTWRIMESSASAIKNTDGTVAKLVIVNRDITERKHTEELLEHNSFHDALTGLPNRRLFLDRLRGSFARAQRNPDFQYALLIVDIDDFKSLNADCGKAVADQVLIESGRRLTGCLRHGDTLARPKGDLPIPDAVLSRLEGDEFMVLLEGVKDASDALRVAQRIQNVLSAPIELEGHKIRTSASVGISWSRDPHERAEELLQKADIALRRAQSLGISRSEMFDEATHNRAANLLSLESDLRLALDYEQFRVYYDPVLDLNTQNTAGMRALVRWKHPTHGLIPSRSFVQVAEAAGLTIPIGRWLLRESCRQFLIHESIGHSNQGYLCMALSPKQFANPHLMTETQVILDEFHVLGSRLQFDVPDSLAMLNPQFTSGIFARMKEVGARIGISGFGAGFSSLNWLRRLQIDEIKIDPLIVASTPSDRASSDVVRMILALGREWKVRVVAEGIESNIHLQSLRKLGCQFGQGSVLSASVPAEKLGHRLHAPALVK